MFYRNNIKWTHRQLMLAMGQQAHKEKGHIHHGQMLTSYLIWIMAHLDDDAIIVMCVVLQQHSQVL